MATVAETMRQIQADCAEDAAALDGKPFNGRSVAETFGETLAMLKVVARCVEILAEKAGA